MLSQSGSEWLESLGKVGSICHFPVRNDGAAKQEGHAAVSIAIDSKDPGEVELARLYAAWALLLRLYTGGERVAFVGATETSASEVWVKPVVVNVEAEMLISDVGKQIRLPERRDITPTGNAQDTWRAISQAEATCNTIIISGSYLGVLERSNLHNKFPIIIFSKPSQLEISYHQNHLSLSQAGNLAGVLKVAILAVAEQSTQKLNTVNLVPKDQWDLVQSWNADPPAHVPSRIHDEFSKFAVLRKHEVAIDAWDGSLTYQELDEASDRLATRLQQLSVGKGDAVMVCAEKTKWVPVSWLAIFKAGATLVPVHLMQPVSRLRVIKAVSKAEVIIATPKGEALAKELSDKICLVGNELLTDAHTCFFDGPSVSPDDTAYILFTSGSTGAPKGIAVSHSAFCSSAKKISGIIKNTQRLLQFASYNFTPAIYEILMPLCTYGSCVCIPSDSARANHLAQYMKESRVDWAVLVPTVLRSQDPGHFDNLKTLLVLGEPMGQAEAARWATKFDLFYSYASSENALVSFNNRMGYLTDIRNVGYSSGTCWIVDPTNHNTLMPIGAVGEVCVYSPGTATCYLNAPEKSKAVFVEDATWVQKPREGFRFCRTGDLMFLNSDGSMSFSGRSDLMVKVRGQRIEIPEVERHVSSVDGVKLGLVCVPTKGKCNDRLVAVIMLEEPPCAVEEFVPSGRLTFAPGTFTSDTVQRFQKALLAKLPEYMIPTSWVVVQTIPLTATGKLDRVSTTAWLQEIDSELCEKIFRSTAAGEIEQLIGDTECRLQQIWAQVLNLSPEAIGRNESFLNLGGDSTSAMTVISQCRKNGIVITVRDVIRSNCIADLARVATLLHLPQEEVISTGIETRVDAAPTTTGEDPSQPAKDDPNIAQVLSCSPMQESLLLSQSKANGQGKYECSFTFKLVSEDGIEPANIVNAWQRVMNRHSALRTFFRESRERPETFEQVVLHQIEANTTIFNLRKMPIEVATFLEGHQTIHSEGKPPHGLAICQKTDKEAFLKLDISHLIFDGFSIAIMMGDLHAAVCGTLSTDYAPSYGQYVDFLQQQNTAQSLEYWRLFLSDLEPCSIPTLRTPAPPKTDGQNLAQLRRVFPHYTHLRKFAMTQATTPSSVIQLAWGLVLRSLLNRDDVAFGVMTSGRETPIEGIEKIVGPVINSIICRCDLNQDRSVKSVLDQLQDEFLDALAHQYVHPGHVQRAAGQKQAIFSTALSVLKSADLTFSENGIKLTSEKQYQPTEFDISLLILLGDESMTTELTFWDGKMTQNQANAIFDTFIQAISAIINISDAGIAQIGSITLLSEDCHMMVDQRARESHIESAESVITELIQETVLRQPDALAISSWDGDLPYQEVDELSSILSLTLVKQHPCI